MGGKGSGRARRSAEKHAEDLAKRSVKWLNENFDDLEIADKIKISMKYSMIQGKDAEKDNEAKIADAIYNSVRRYMVEEDTGESIEEGEQPKRDKSEHIRVSEERIPEETSDRDSDEASRQNQEPKEE